MHKYALVLVALCPLLIAPGVAVAAQPDWWLIFGSGDQPKRQVMYADALSVADTPLKSAAEPARSVDVVEVFEAQDKPLYVMYRVSFQCKAGRYSVATASAQMRSGAVTREPTSSQWEPVARSVMERPYDFVCKASSRRANSMIKIGMPQSATIIPDGPKTLPEFTYNALWGAVTNAPRQ